MDKKKIFKKILVISSLCLFIFVFYLALEKDKVNRIEHSIIKFQEEYQQFIDKESFVNAEMLDKFAQSDILGSDSLAQYYKNFQSKAYKSFEKQYRDELYIFNFLKNDNLNSYSKESRELYESLVKENIELASELDKKYDVDKLKIFQENNIQIKELAVLHLHSSSLVISAYKDAQDNSDTTIQTAKSCFMEQEINDEWQHSKELSQSFCDKLGLGTCSSESGTETFIGYTLNNPKKVDSKKEYIEYVSYFDSDFRVTDFEALKEKYQEDNRFYAEVYVKEIENRKIYKYNVVAIENEYSLSCESP